MQITGKHIFNIIMVLSIVAFILVFLLKLFTDLTIPSNDMRVLAFLEIVICLCGVLINVKG